MKKPWGVAGLIIIGFAIGFVAAEANLGDSVATFSATSDSLIRKDNSKVEDYWEQTNLKISDLRQYVNNKSCKSNNDIFIGCVNSVLFALSKTNYHLMYDGAIVMNERPEDRLDNNTEKQNLAPFINLYKDQLVSSFDFEKMWDKILALDSQLSHKYLIGLGINGYLSATVDPHTYISPTKFFQEVSSVNERSKYFLGISFEKRKTKVYIRKIFKGSDADQSGLQANDEVISVNGTNVSNMNMAEISALISQNRDQKIVPFVIQRGNVSYVKKVVRTYRVLSQVQAEVFPGTRIGYVQLSKFSYGVCENVKKELTKMKSMSLHGLILDLRDNPGGLLSEAACLAGLFLGEDQKIFSIKYIEGRGQDEVALTTEQQIYFGPMTVLVNNSSASASELIAGAMKEYGRAVIIGETTFGKGSFQEIENWSSKAGISLFETKGFYLLPSGDATQLVGVQPDIEINDQNLVMSEFENYFKPLKYEKNDMKIEKISIHKSKLNGCSVFSQLSTDQFIAKAQKTLGCDIELSAAKYEDKSNKNINL